MRGLELGLGLTRAISGGGVAPVTLAAPVFSDDFTYTDGTRLVAGDPNANAGLVGTNPGNLNWTAITTGAAANIRYNLIVFGGVLTNRTANGVSDFTSPGRYFLTPPANNSISGNQTIAFEHEQPTGAARADALAIDEANRLSTVITKTGSISVVSMVAGTPTTVVTAGSFSSKIRMGGTNGGFRLIDGATERLTTVIFNGKVYPRRGPGFPIGPLAGTSFTSPGGTLIGVHTHNDEAVRVGKIEAIATATRLDINPTHDIWVPKKRSSSAQAINEGTGTMTFTGTYEGTAPAKLQYAFAAQGTGTIVKDWALVPDADLTIGAGTFTAIIRNIPVGLNGRGGICPGFRVVDASNVADPYTAIFSNRECYVTLNIGFIGQSNAVNMQNTITTKTARVDGLCRYGKADPPSVVKGTIENTPNFWEDTTTYTGGKNWFALGDALATRYNIPVSVEILAIAARGASALGPGGADWSYIQTHHAFAGGAYDILYLSQGENEFAAAGSWSTQWVNTNLPAYRDPAMHGQPAGTVIPVFYAMTGRYTGTITSETDAAAHSLRVQQEALSGLVSNSYFAHTYTGIEMSDTFHYTNDLNKGYGEATRRLLLTVNKVLDGTGYDGLGPSATSASRSGAVVTVSFGLNGATGLAARNGTNQDIASSATALTGWQVSADDFATLLTITSAELVGNQVVITLSANPGAAVKVRWHYGINPDISSAVAGSYADGSFICMRPLLTPLVTT